MDGKKDVLHYLKRSMRKSARKCLEHLNDVIDRMETDNEGQFSKKDDVLHATLLLAWSEAAELFDMLDFFVYAYYGQIFPTDDDEKGNGDEECDDTDDDTDDDEIKF